MNIYDACTHMCVSKSHNSDAIFLNIVISFEQGNLNDELFAKCATKPTLSLKTKNDFWILVYDTYSGIGGSQKTGVAMKLALLILDFGLNCKENCTNR